MTEAPSYLRLLNGISCAESRAHEYLSAWADVTTDPDVRAVLRTVVAREGEHGMAFAKRVNELGFEVQPTDDPHGTEWLEIARSDRPDLEKAELLELLKYASEPGEPDVFDTFFRDHTIDIQTGELLGRYIAEERDTIRLFQGCRGAVAGPDPGCAGVSRPVGRAGRQDRRRVPRHRGSAPDRLRADHAHRVGASPPRLRCRSREHLGVDVRIRVRTPRCSPRAHASSRARPPICMAQRRKPSGITSRGSARSETRGPMRSAIGRRASRSKP